MGARQRPGAEGAVQAETVGGQDVQIGSALVVPELADVVVARSAVEDGGALPAEQHVAGRLHQALALDHALAVVVVIARSEVALEDRRLGLLELEEQRVVVVAAEHEQHPVPGADAADADDLAGEVDDPEAAAAALGGHRTGWRCRHRAGRRRHAARPRPRGRR